MGLWAFPLLSIAGCVVLGLFMRFWSKGPRRLREGRVTGIIGRKGHGKSMFMVHEALRTLGEKQLCAKCTDEQGRKVFHPRRVAANFDLRAPEARHQQYVHRIRSFDDLYDLPHMTLCFIDEIGIWFPAANGAPPLPESVRHMLGQCRKYVLEIVWCTQREDRVTLGVRAQTDEIGICRKGAFRQMSVRFFEPEDVQQGRPKNNIKPLWTYRYRVNRKLGRAYNTYEFIALDGSAGEGVRATKSPDPKPATVVSVTDRDGHRVERRHIA